MPQNGRRSSHILQKEVRLMRITFHVGDFTVTVMIRKRRNRHPARWRFLFVRKPNPTGL